MINLTEGKIGLIKPIRINDQLPEHIIRLCFLSVKAKNNFNNPINKPYILLELFTLSISKLNLSSNAWSAEVLTRVMTFTLYLRFNCRFNARFTGDGLL